MSTPSPQSKLLEVSDFMNQHQGMINPNRLELSRWLRDAQALRQSEPALGYTMEGLIYRAQGKIAIGLEYLKKAYRLDSLLAGENYSLLLADNGKYDDAERVALDILKNDRANSGLLNFILSSVPYSLNNSRLTQAIDMFKPTNPNAEKILELAKLMLKDIDEVSLSLELSNVSVDTYKHYWKLASIVKSTNYMNYMDGSNVTITHQINELGTFLMINDSLINVSVDDCMRMNDELIEAVINDDYPFEKYRKIVFNFLPAKDKSKDISTHEAFSV